MTNPPPPYQIHSCWQKDGTLRPIDEQFEASEKLFRGFTVHDLEEVGGAMPGICFRFDPHCSVNRGKYSEWQSIAKGEEHSHRGVMEVTVETVSISSEIESKPYATRVLHSPDTKEADNYAHTDICVPIPLENFSKNERRKAGKHWRTKLDERINGLQSDKWKTNILRNATPKNKTES